MIDIVKGNIFLREDNIIINKNYSKEKFINSSLFKTVFNKFESSYTSNYSIKPQVILGNEFGLTLTFKKSSLESISLITTEIKGIPFDEENEEKIKMLHDKWLEKLFGKPHETGPYWLKYNFEWGEVLSSLDPRAGQSEISFVFK
jgi:CRISPR/Cas system CMR-associated protein Cmr5 small subunit